MKMEKSVISNKITVAWLFALAMAICAAAQQENFRPGETVETGDGRICKILSVTGRSAKVACGANRSDLRVYSFDSLMSEAAAEAKREQSRQKQNAANAPRQPTTMVFRQGDAVETPDGRTGKIESFKLFSDLVKVQFADGSTQYFELNDLKKAVDPMKPTFRVGDTVISPRSPNKTPGVIESINGSGARVRYGRGKYDYVDDLLENLISPQQAAEDQESERQEKMQKPLRAQFMDEAQAFSTTVYAVAPIFNPKYQPSGTGITQENNTYEAWRKDLESLDVVCRKYPNMTNPVMGAIYQGDIKNFPADWCKIAAQRAEVLQKTKKTVGDIVVKNDIHSWTLKVQEALDAPDGYVRGAIQTLLYDRAAWNRENLPGMTKIYLDPNATVSPELLKPLEEKVAELRAKIELDAPNRSWKQPNFTDAALEGSVKRLFSSESPGVKVYKTGMTYTTWKAMDDKSFIGSDSNYRFYRITKGAYRFKLGLALVKLPNQPFCQIKEFQLTQHKAGAGYGAAKPSIDGGGVFVKCP